MCVCVCREGQGEGSSNPDGRPGSKEVGRAPCCPFMAESVAVLMHGPFHHLSHQGSPLGAWGIPWTEEPGWLQSIGSQRVGHRGGAGCECVCVGLHVWRVGRDRGRASQPGPQIPGKFIDSWFFLALSSSSHSLSLLALMCLLLLKPFSLLYSITHLLFYDSLP